ncbi:MAG: NAD(P)/FAD-dependent oxidoreductase [Alphaproteobacteria bacterium]|nr:NAD(P)/FAD-dependent oxidoreductase [Alphaproteobacteria bacterium]
MTPDVQTLVIGAGVVGLAIARQLAQSGHEVLVLERHNKIGAETSSRNSEVIHAGLYYPTDSLRAQLCVAGKKLLYEFAGQNAIAVKRCGKLLVATKQEDLPALREIARQAAVNGVDDTRLLNRSQAHELEPELTCAAALHSPSTGVIDTHELMTALEGHLTASGGQVVLSTEVAQIHRQDEGIFSITTRNPSDSGSETSITTRNLIIAAGLEATNLARLLAGSWPETYTPPTTFLGKGHYFTLSAKTPFSHLIYPVPSGAWLGIHLTLDIGGQAKFGPDLQWVDTVDYSFDDPDGIRRAAFIREIKRYWPGIPSQQLHQGYTGIRPKIYKRGQPPADFAIHGPKTHGLNNCIALYGIESPGLTSSLAIAELVARQLQA